MEVPLEVNFGGNLHDLGTSNLKWSPPVIIHGLDASISNHPLLATPMIMDPNWMNKMMGGKRDRDFDNVARITDKAGRTLSGMGHDFHRRRFSSPMATFGNGADQLASHQGVYYQ